MSREEILLKIAEKHLFIGTFETRRDDNLNYYDLPVWDIKKALDAAYQAGVDAHKDDAER